MSRSSIDQDFHGHKNSALMLFPGVVDEEIEHNYEYTTGHRRWFWNWVPQERRHRLNDCPFVLIALHSYPEVQTFIEGYDITLFEDRMSPLEPDELKGLRLRIDGKRCVILGNSGLMVRYRRLYWWEK